MTGFKCTSLLLRSILLLLLLKGYSQTITANIHSSAKTETFLLHKPPQGALKDKNGAIIRGTPMVLGKMLSRSLSFAQNIDNWRTLQHNGYNTVRVCWVDPWYWDHQNKGWTVAEVLPHLDQVVQNATTTGMNLIINFHNVGAQQEYDKNYRFALENEFWKAVAPRYKDNDLVYYEPANEPTFTMSDYLKMDFKKAYLELYSTIRSLAPERQVLFFSFNGITPEILKVVEDYEDFIDWQYTTIAYHMYNSSTSESIRAVMEHHSVMCTEWFYDHLSSLPGNGFIKQVDGYKLNAQTLEKMGSGWCDWRDWDDITLNETLDTLIGDAHAKDYWWGKPVPGIRASGISLSCRKLELACGRSKKLTAFVLPALAEDQQITWTTSDARIASVDAKGLVTAVSSGSAVITAVTRDGSFGACCEITIR